MMPLRARGGFLLLEGLLGLTLFSMFLFAAGIVLMQGQEGSIIGGDRVRAAFHTQRAIEASRSIRDGSFTSLADGLHGTKLTSGTWSYNGTQTVASGGYTTALTVSHLAHNWVRLVAQTAWKRGISRSGSLILQSELTDWRANRRVGNWSALSLTGSYVVNNAYFNDVALTGSSAFVTSEISDGGAGLYVLNVQNLAAPALLTTVNIGGAGYHAVIKGRVLYVITSDSSAELKAYDITNPASPSLKTSYNLPGSGRAKTLVYSGNRLLVGGIPNGAVGERAVYLFDITSSGTLTLMTHLDDAGTVSAIALSGTSAYLADSEDAAELEVLRRGTGSLALHGSYNLSDDTKDALSIALSGTSALLGREKTSFQELVVFDVSKSGVPSSPGPWYHEGSGSLVGVAADGNACFGFLAASSGRKALQVVHLFDKTNLPELTTHTSTTGKGRGVRYDPVRDKVYLLTDNAVLMFQAGGVLASSSCP